MIGDPATAFMVIPEYVYRSNEIGCDDKMFLGMIFGIGGGIGDCSATDDEIGEILGLPAEEVGSRIASLSVKEFLADIGKSHRSLFVTNPAVDYSHVFKG